MRLFFKKEDLDTELGVILGDFNPRGTATNNSGDVRTSSEANASGGSKMIYEGNAGNMVVLWASAGGKDEKSRGVFMTVNRNGVRVQKSSKALNAGDISGFEIFNERIANLHNSLILASGDGREIITDFLVF